MSKTLDKGSAKRQHVNRTLNDPEWQARKLESERIAASVAAATEQRRALEEPLRVALAEVGFPVRTVWDLVNSPGPYREAIPILLEHLERPYPDRIRDGIARSLAVSDAEHAWSRLAQAYRNEPLIKENGVRSETKSGLAAALAATVTDSTLDELISLARDKSHGSSRILLLSALRRRSKRSAAKEAIAELASDPELAKEIASWRRR